MSMSALVIPMPIDSCCLDVRGHLPQGAYISKHSTHYYTPFELASDQNQAKNWMKEWFEYP